MAGLIAKYTRGVQAAAPSACRRAAAFDFYYFLYYIFIVSN